MPRPSAALVRALLLRGGSSAGRSLARTPLLLPLDLAVRRRAAARARDELVVWRAQQTRRFPARLALSVATQAAEEDSLAQRLRRWLRLARHLGRQLSLGLPLLLLRLLVEAARAWGPTALTEALEHRWLALAHWAALRSSPVVMKGLQWASARRDLFSAAFCDRFEEFHERAPAHAWAATEAALRRALGEDWASVLDVDPRAPPIGSGCIAQVHCGTLRASGERVAVKVVHPHVRELVALDLELLRLAVRALEALPALPLLGARAGADEFAAIMGRQLDLRAEAENLLRFQRHFRGRRGALGFPTPHLALTTESVLVESFEDGLHFRDVCAQLDAPSRKAAARVLLQSFLQMVFLDNFAHGDLHPGNLLFAASPPRGGRDARPRHTNALLALLGEARQERERQRDAAAPVVALDAGIVTRLEPEELRNFVELFHAVATGDGYRAGELIIARSKPVGGKPAADDLTDKCADVETFCSGIAAIVDEALGCRLSLRNVHVGALLRRVMELCCAHQVRLEGKYASVIVSIAVLEAVGRELDPDVDLLAAALPVILQSKAQSALRT